MQAVDLKIPTGFNVAAAPARSRARADTTQIGEVRQRATRDAHLLLPSVVDVHTAVDGDGKVFGKYASDLPRPVAGEPVTVRVRYNWRVPFSAADRSSIQGCLRPIATITPTFIMDHPEMEKITGRMDARQDDNAETVFRACRDHAATDAVWGGQLATLMNKGKEEGVFRENVSKAIYRDRLFKEALATKRSVEGKTAELTDEEKSAIEAKEDYDDYSSFFESKEEAKAPAKAAAAPSLSSTSTSSSSSSSSSSSTHLGTLAASSLGTTLADVTATAESLGITRVAIPASSPLSRDDMGYLAFCDVAAIRALIARLSQNVRDLFEELVATSFSNFNAPAAVLVKLPAIAKHVDAVQAMASLSKFAPNTAISTNCFDVSGQPTADTMTRATVSIIRAAVASGARYANLTNYVVPDTVAAVTADIPRHATVRNGGEYTDLAEEVFWLFTRSQVRDGTDEQKDMFANVRVYGCRFNYYVDSDEVTRALDDTPFVIRASLADMESAGRNLTNTVPAEVCLVTALVSYLECGHHATATRLSHKMSAIANAVGWVITDQQASALIPHAVYHGTHPFSMRLLYGSQRAVANTGNLSSAIAKRIHKAPPGITAYVQLEIWIESLASANFFKIMNREAELSKFRDAMIKIKHNMHLKAPYSSYFFGDALPEDVNEKAICDKFAAYAIAIRDTAPGSTLREGVALAKISTAAAANAFVAGLDVRAYQRAYLQAAERMVTAQVALSTRAVAPAPPAIMPPAP